MFTRTDFEHERTFYEIYACYLYSIILFVLYTYTISFYHYKQMFITRVGNIYKKVLYL